MHRAVTRHSVLFVACALGMSLCDRVHLAYGVLRQEGWSLFGQALWVLPLFGAGGVAMALGHGTVRGWLSEPLREASARKLLVATGLGGLAYCVTGPLQGFPVLLAIVLAATWVVRAIRSDSRSAVVFSLLLGVIGPSVEATIAHFGCHTYARPDLLGVPMWLPGIYLHGGFLAAQLEPFTARAISSGRDPTETRPALP